MTTDVIIVGGGPVGLGLSIDLAQREISSLVLERSTALHHIPKGQNLTQRTGEHFRSWGVSEAVRAATPIPPSFGNAGMVAYGSLLGDYTYDWFRRGAVGQYYFAENERLPQYRLEAVLRDRAAEFPAITYRRGMQVTHVTQTETAAEVVAIDPDGKEHRNSASYVIGCDGARSTVREAAEIAQDVDHTGPRMALLVFRSAELHELLERYPGKSIYNVMKPGLDGYWHFLGRVDLEGGWFYHAPVPAGTTADNYDFRAHLYETIGASFDLAFEHIGFWDLRISHAQTYRNGRLFIAGDAGHSHPPYGGYGINTGLEDARNLSWKLAAVIDGWAGPDLLDSYSTERHPVFASTSEDFIGRMIRDDRAFCEAYSPDRDRVAFEAAWADRASGGNADVTQFLPNYAGSPIVFGEAGSVSGAKGVHSWSAAAGFHLSPQPLASERELWDALGPGFTLLDLTSATDASDAFVAAAQRQGIPLSVVDGFGPEARDAWGASLILVRPDLFVAWTGENVGNADAVLARARGA